MRIRAAVISAWIATSLCPVLAATFPFDRDHVIDKSLHPGNRDVYFIIDGMAVSYAKDRRTSDVLKALIESDKLTQTVTYGGQEVLLTIADAEDRDAVNEMMSRLANNNLRIEDLGDDGINIWFRTSSVRGFSAADRVLLKQALGAVHLKNDEPHAAIAEFESALRMESQLGLNSARTLDYLALARRVTRDDRTAYALLRESADQCDGLTKCSTLWRASFLDHVRDPKIHTQSSTDLLNQHLNMLNINAPARPAPPYLAPGLWDTWDDLMQIALNLQQADSSRQGSVNAEIAHMRAVVAGALRREGIATIQGTLLVPRDEAVIERTRTRTAGVNQSETEFVSGASETKKDAFFDVENLEVKLLRKRGLTAFNQALEHYAEANGLNATEFGKTWPTIHDQAEDVRALLAQVMNRPEYSYTSDKTSKSGDYRFGNVPKGKYAVFATLNNGGAAMLWFRPVQVDKKATLTVSLNQQTATLLWRRPPELKANAF